MFFSKEANFSEKVQMIERKFLYLFPESFEDKEWLKLSKKHSTQAIDTIFNTSLSKKTMKNYLKSGEISEIISACKTVIQRSTTISMFEKIAFRNFMLDSSLHKEFATLLYNFMYVDYKKYFADFVYLLTRTRNSIGNSDCAKWTIVTSFLAHCNKDYHVFLKPSSSKNTAFFFNIDIQYQAYPNLETYEKFRDIIINFKKLSKLTHNKKNEISQAVIFCALSIMYE